MDHFKFQLVDYFHIEGVMKVRQRLYIAQSIGPAVSNPLGYRLYSCPGKAEEKQS